MAVHNVLRVNAVEEQTTERNAVARILLDIQRETGLTLLEIAERIDVSLGTISNAANKKTDLCRTYMKRLGIAFGGHCLDPWLALAGVRSVPLDRGNVKDILPLMMQAGAKVASARDRDGPGGERELHTEQLGYLPELKRLQAEMAKVICEIESLAA